MLSRGVLACAVVIVPLMFSGLALPPVKLSSPASPPMRTWFFHNYWANKQWFYTMNESSPELHTDDPSYGLGFFYFGPKSGDPYDQSRTGLNLTFALSPSYPFGFELVPGQALVDLWMQGQGGYNFPPTKLQAEFNFTLSASKGQIL